MGSARRSVLRTAGVLPGMLGARFAFIAMRDALEEGRRAPGLEPTIRRLLRLADGKLTEGQIADAADPAGKALHLLFHPLRAAAIAPGRTPEQDSNLLAPLRRSSVGRLLLDGENAGRRSASEGERPGAVSPTDDEPDVVRVLVIGHRNMLFADRLIDDLAEVPGLRLLRLDLSDLGLDEDVRLQPLTRARLRTRIDGTRVRPPRELAEQIEASDVVLAEWGNHTTAYLSMLEGVGADLGGVPLVTRVHRFEVDTAYFHLIDLAAVDHWMFIAAHIRDRALRLRPIGADRTSLVANINDLRRFVPDKDPLAGRTLLHTDWSREAKDVGFAFDVLTELHRTDSRWRLLLAGSPPSTAASQGRENRARAESLGDAVEILGRREDMPEVMRRAGFVLSTSQAEGSHEVVAEGAAAACVPVVRNWPENRADGGAAGVYPPDWVVESPQEAAERILRFQDPSARQHEGSTAREHILRVRDAEAIRRRYAVLLRRIALGRR